jgi:tetratricopeptide (TPR) repeat protein
LHDDLECAEKAFFNAQTLDPELSRAWMGMAIVGERTGDGRALSNFQHAAEVRDYSDAEANYGFALSMFRKHRYDSETDWVHLPAFALTKSSELDSQDVHMLNLLGLLLEKIGLHTSAAQHIETALKCTESKADKSALQLNLVRLHCANRHFKQSLSLQVPPTDVGSVIVQSLCYLFEMAVARSVSLLETALGMADTGSKADISVLLGQALYSQHNDACRDMAMQYLLQWCVM